MCQQALLVSGVDKQTTSEKIKIGALQLLCAFTGQQQLTSLPARGGNDRNCTSATAVTHLQRSRAPHVAAGETEA
jgi:hypothetical protein